MNYCRFIASIVFVFIVFSNSHAKNYSLALSLKTFQQKNSDSLPRPAGWTNDLEHLYAKNEIKKLDSIISSFEHKTTIEICIVTLGSDFTTKENFDGFVTQLHDEWGIGKKESNNGIVIGISKEFRKMRISTGRGLVKKLPDSEAKKIIDEDFIPPFKQSDYFNGTLNGLQAIIKKLQSKLK